MRRLFLVLVAVGVLLALGVSTAVGQGPTVQGLVLWNKLGSEQEVLHSEIGAGFGIQLGAIHVPGLYGGALATTGGTQFGGGGYLTMSPDDFFGPDKTRGTVEMWLEKRIPKFIPYRTPLVGIFGVQPYDWHDPIKSYGSISAYWSDGYTGGGGLHFQIRDDGGANHFCNDLGWDNVPVGEWTHVAFVWDVNGIGGTADKMRIYRDGVVVGANTDLIPGIKPDANLVKILAHHFYSRFGQPTAYMDNLKVWDFAKTDFSDRFNEAPYVEVEIDIKPGSYPNTINLKSKGVVPVAVLNTPDFYTGAIDPNTIVFAGASPERWVMEDVDGDGDLDLLLHFRTQDLNLTEDSIKAALTGNLHGGLPIVGTDTVEIVPKGK